MAKLVAFEMLLRNQAYSNVLELLFPTHVRLSIAWYDPPRRNEKPGSKEEQPRQPGSKIWYQVIGKKLHHDRFFTGGCPSRKD